MSEQPAVELPIVVQGDRVTVTIAPEQTPHGGQGVSVERFVGALEAVNTLLTTLDPHAEPYLYLGGGVDRETGAVTIHAGPARGTTT
jgi:hypothetical protein